MNQVSNSPGTLEMAYDRDDGYYHLTPEGWKRLDKEPFPGNRLETWRYTMSQSSGWSKEYANWQCVWASPDHTREERDAVRACFPIDRGDRRRCVVTVGAPL